MLQQRTNLISWILWFVFWAMLITVGICTFPNCSKNHPLEPVPADTVFVHEHHDHIVHEHHDHEIVVTDTLFQFITCDTVDLLIQFTVIGDQSQPNIYEYYVNGVFRGRITIRETFLKPTEVTFEVLFEGMASGDIITIRPVSGSRAGVVGLSVVGRECSS